MKTETAPAATTGPKPGNLSVRELASTLIKSAPATSQKKENDTAPAELETVAKTRKPSPAAQARTEAAPENEDETASAETELDETESNESAETDTETDSSASDDTAETEETGSESEDSTETETEVDDSSVADQVSERLENELAPLIEELQTAGAKGALQILQKRIPKLVDQRDTERNARLSAEEQNAQLRRELQSAREGTSDGGNATAGVQHPEVARVSQELASVDHWLAYCEDALPKLTGGETEFVELPDGKGGKIQLDARKVTALHRDLQNQRTELVAQKAVVEQSAKAAFKEAYAKHHAEAVTQYPWIRNANSPEHQEMQAILKVFPAFKQSPDYELAIGDFIAGKALREARAKAKAKPTSLKKPTAGREPTKVVSAPPGGGLDREPSAEKEVKAAEAQFRKSGKTADLARWNAAKARVNRAGNARAK